MDLCKEEAILEQKLDDARDQGILIGQEKGGQEGIKVGVVKEKIEIAKNSLKAGVSIEYLFS